MAAVSHLLSPDEGAIRQFVMQVIGQDIHLAAITPDGPIAGHYFGDAVEEAVAWAVEHNGNGRNIYWTANVCHAGVSSKPSKKDIRSARFAHVDIDPPKDGSAFDKAFARQSLDQLFAPPSVIVNSGNGLQALWKLGHDIEELERVEAINKAIAVYHAGDSGHNIDKLLRLPGTVNYPNGAKRSRGCIEVMATLESCHLERLYDLGTLEAEFQPAPGQVAPPQEIVMTHGQISLLTSHDLSRGDLGKLAAMIDKPAEYFRTSDRSAWAYGIACQMIDDRYADEQVLGILLNPLNNGCSHVRDQSDPVRAAKRALARARARFLPANGSIFANPNQARHNRPTIRFVGGNLPEAVDQAEQALIAADIGYYQMGGRIVRIGALPSLQVGLKDRAQWRMIDVSEAELVEAFTTVADWAKPAKNGDAQINCPNLVAETYLARRGKWSLPALVGVIDVPTLRSDGTVLASPGYDRRSGLLLKPSGTVVPPISNSPSRSDAIAALAALEAPLTGFPFVADADRSVALSALLTAACRSALGSAPLHGISAPTAGSGKSTIIDLASILRTGRSAATIAQGKNAEELEKRLGAMFLEGEGFVAIDNCESPLGGEFLCQALTQSALKVRPLGKSAVIEVPTMAVMTATGNNLTFVGDMSRRALLCQLDPGVERPELREFSFDPIVYALANRGNLVAAALTILRAYHVAGCPHQVAPLGSFADWSNLVRSALMWLGCADPCDTMEKVRKADPQMALIKHVMAQWGKAFGRKAVTTGDLAAKAEEVAGQSSGSATIKNPKYPELRDALLAVAGEGARINGRKLGRWLSGQQGRVVNGHKFVSTGTRGGQLLWTLTPTCAAPTTNARVGG
jgi:hypothetical protein